MNENHSVEVQEMQGMLTRVPDGVQDGQGNVCVATGTAEAEMPRQDPAPTGVCAAGAPGAWQSAVPCEPGEVDREDVMVWWGSFLLHLSFLRKQSPWGQCQLEVGTRKEDRKLLPQCSPSAGPSVGKGISRQVVLSS